jgi:hypothetical protein
MRSKDAKPKVKQKRTSDWGCMGRWDDREESAHATSDMHMQLQVLTVYVRKCYTCWFANFALAKSIGYKSSGSSLHTLPRETLAYPQAGFTIDYVIAGRVGKLGIPARGTDGEKNVQ